MGGTSSSNKHSYRKLIQNYDLIQQCKQQGLSYLQSKSTHQQYLLRQVTCSDHQSFAQNKKMYDNRMLQLEGNRHIVALRKISVSQEDQYCMTFYKIYTLWEFPQRTLEDQINQRLLQKRKFQEKQLWSILASCILGLSHLQKQDIKHNALKSGVILIDPNGIIKLYDPIATGVPNNYEKLLAYRSQPHLYLSPEQVDSLKEQRSTANCDPFKTDIWTLGMILLQAGLLSYQDECYRQQYSKIHWETLKYNINRFQHSYSPELTNLLEFMLAKDERSRPDWAELEEHVIKIQEDNQPTPKQNQNFLEKIFGKMKSTSKLKAPEQTQTKLLFFQKKPISISRDSFNDPTPSMTHQPLPILNHPPPSHPPQPHTTSMISQPIPIFKPSDISATRPFRNIFPTNTYKTHTNIDQNVVYDEDESSIKQKSMSNLDNNKTSNSAQGNALGQYVRQAYTQGSRYEGYKVNGIKHGIGRFYYQDGGMYEGQWVNGHIEGYGKLFYQSQRLAYDGQWKQDQFCGRGSLHNQYPEHLNHPFDYHNFNQIQQYWTKYQGNFYGDMKHGSGTLHLSNGQYYQGQFKNDFVEGKGTFFTARGQKIDGIWQKNIKIQ